MSITTFFVMAGSIAGIVFGPLAVFSAYGSAAEYLRRRRVRKDLAKLPSHKRIQQIQIASTWFRERQEAYWVEVCHIYGVDPNQQSVERDWCAEIVYDGESYAEIERRMRKQDDLYLS